MATTATMVNAHNSQTLGEAFERNPFVGTLGAEQGSDPVTAIAVVLSDDSPEDGRGGAALFAHDIIITAEDFTTGSSFHRVLWDDAEKGHSETTLKPDAEIKRVVMCSGKVYYDLLEERDARGLDDVYILRIEQFYPFPALSLVKELERFKGAEMIWCQEEPKNQGAWTFIEPNIEWVLGRIDATHKRPVYVGRATSASPATGLASQHKAQQEALVNEALTIEGN